MKKRPSKEPKAYSSEENLRATSSVMKTGRECKVISNRQGTVPGSLKFQA
jgi:hypothetical protein